MNLLIVKTSMGLGGIERSLIEFLRHLDYNKYHVDMLLLYGPFDLCPDISNSVHLINADRCGRQIRFYPLYMLFYLFQKIFQIFHISCLSEKYKNSKNDFYYRTLYTKYCCKHYDAGIAYQQGFACKYVAKYVSADQKVMMYHHGAIQDQEYLEPLFRAADKVVAVSEGMDHKLVEVFPFLAGKTTVIENYEDADYIRKKAEEYIPEMDSGTLNLCTCGRISSEKGIDLAIESAALLQQKKIKFHWYFVGDGYDQQYVAQIQKKIAALQLSDTITITGFLTNPYPYLKHCDLLIIPSLFEANPMIVKEGIFMRCAIIATKTAGVMDLLQDKVNALLCDFSPSSLADKIQFLSEMPELQQQFKKNLPIAVLEQKQKIFYQQWDKLLDNRIGK